MKTALITVSIVTALFVGYQNQELNAYEKELKTTMQEYNKLNHKHNELKNQVAARLCLPSLALMELHNGK